MPCSAARGSVPSATSPNGQKPLFTDYTFDNLGVPKNPENPVYVTNPVSSIHEIGWFPGNPGSTIRCTLQRTRASTRCRRCEMLGKGLATITKAYTHNGYFKTLEGIVKFYDTAM